MKLTDEQIMSLPENMPKGRLYMLHDSASGTYTAPTFHTAREQARRSFSDSVNSGQDVPLCRHPQHFTLFEIGLFCQYTGEVELYESKVSVANGAEVKLPDQPDMFTPAAA